jgi:hypothetical protein
VERQILHINPNTEIMAARNPEIGRHATIAYIMAIGKHRNVMKGAGGLVAHK